MQSTLVNAYLHFNRNVMRNETLISYNRAQVLEACFQALGGRQGLYHVRSLVKGARVCLPMIMIILLMVDYFSVRCIIAVRSSSMCSVVSGVVSTVQLLSS